MESEVDKGSKFWFYLYENIQDTAMYKKARKKKRLPEEDTFGRTILKRQRSTHSRGLADRKGDEFISADSKNNAGTAN